MAHNRLGSAGLKAILQLVDCSCLQSLDLSATRLHDSAFASPERIGRILADAYANLVCFDLRNLFFVYRAFVSGGAKSAVSEFVGLRSG